MKLSSVAFNSFVLIVAFFGTPSVEANGFSVVAVSNDASKHSPTACDADHSLIEDAITKAVKSVDKSNANTNNNKNVRSLTSCSVLCRAWTYNTCFIAYPWCYPLRRRELKGEGGAYVIPDNVKEDHSLMCAKAIVAVEDAMAALVDKVKSADCKAVLQDTKTYQCYMES